MAKYCSCKIRPCSYRQTAVGIAREYINPSKYKEDNTIDEVAHHGVWTAHAHYGIVEGDLPNLTSDLVWRHRAIGAEWHNIVGVGLCKPPRPLRQLMGGFSFAASDLDPSSHAADAGLNGGVTQRQLEEALDRNAEALLAKV